MKKTLKDRISEMDERTKRQFFRSSWLTSCAVFGIIMLGIMFNDGVVDAPKVTVAIVVFILVSLILFIHFKSLVFYKS